MTRSVIAMMMMVVAGAASAQPAAPIQPSVDSAGQRQSLRALVGCVAKSRQAWARQLLAQPYLGEGQSRAAGELFEGRDNCLRGKQVEMTFRTSSIVSSLAEHFLRSDLAAVDQERLARTLNSLAPANASEDFGLCVAARDPATASALSLSEPGSSEETWAAGQLAAFVEPCAAKGEKLTVDLQGLRGLMSIALYRAMTSVKLARN
jgi:hypothetical protein